MPKGKCNRCSRIYYSWAFAEEDCSKESRACECGGEIENVEPGEVEDTEDLTDG